MQRFPRELTPESKDDFPRMRRELMTQLLRARVTDLICRCDENDFFDLSMFARENALNDNEMTSIRDTVRGELEDLGWKVKTSFGGTGLFIYSSQDPPPSCYSDEF